MIKGVGKRLLAPLQPSCKDNLNGEPSRYSAVLLAAIAVATVGNFLLGYRLRRHGIDYVSSGVPFYLLLLLVEAWLLRAGAVRSVKGARYSSADTWSSLAAGTTQLVINTTVKHFIPAIVIYPLARERIGWWDITSTLGSVGGFIAAFLLGDLTYYWFHRQAHEIGILWLGHNVHHSSEHYNLSTALRQSWLQACVSPLWSLPWATVLPAEDYLVALQWVTIYQFWIHTCVIRRLGMLEYVLNTPSHHRVHHDRRVHKNFGGVLIVWDRLFGTFQDELDVEEVPCANGVEQEEITYFGIQQVVPTWAEAALQCMWLVPALRRPVRGPGWYTSTARRSLPRYASPDMPRFRKYEGVAPAAQCYLWSQYIATFALMLWMIARMDVWSSSTVLAVTAFIWASLVCQGLQIDGARSFVLIEMARCSVGAFLMTFLDSTVLHWFFIASATAVASPFLLGDTVKWSSSDPPTEGIVVGGR